MADAALLSVVFTGTVGVLGAVTGLGGHLITARNEDRKREEERRADLRSVLDGAAAIALASGWSVTPEKTFREIANSVGEERAAIISTLGRVGVRVGPRADVYKHLKRLEELTESRCSCTTCPRTSPRNLSPLSTTRLQKW